MNPILDELSQMHENLKLLMQDDPDWNKQKKYVEKLESLDIKSIGEDMITDLEESFGFWMDPEMTGLDEATPIGCVYFEWGYDNWEATGYGYEECVFKKGNIFIDRKEFDLIDSTFYDCGGIIVTDIMDLECENRITEFLDLQIFKVAEALHYALDEAVKSESFAHLAKKERVHFIAGQHDRWPALAYTCNK